MTFPLEPFAVLLVILVLLIPTMNATARMILLVIALVLTILCLIGYGVIGGPVPVRVH
jgi:hypothetical protein